MAHLTVHFIDGESFACCICMLGESLVLYLVKVSYKWYPANSCAFGVTYCAVLVTE